MPPIFKVPRNVRSPMRDYVRIAVMIVMLLVVLSMFMVFRVRTQPAAPGLPAGGAGSASPAREGVLPKDAPAVPIDITQGNEQEMLARLRDDASLAEDKEPYYYMLAKIFNMSQAEIDRKVDPALKPFNCMEDPKACRGKFLRFDGSLWRLNKVDMNPESGFESVYEGTIARQGPAGGPYVFCTIILTQKPDARIQPEKSNVVFSGVFLKRIVYENRGAPDEQGRRNWTMSPLFIGRTLAIAPPVRVVGRMESYVFFALGFAALVVFAYFVLRPVQSGHERHFTLPADEDQELDATEEREKDEESEPDSSDEESPGEEPSSTPDDSPSGSQDT